MAPGLAGAALALLALQALVVAAASAARPTSNIYITIVIVSVATSPLAFVSDRLLLGQELGRDGRIFLSLTHLALGGFLFHFMTLPDRSVTLRILVELLRAPGEVLSTEALGERYGLRSMIASRLEQLSAGGFISIERDGQIALTPKGRWFGRAVTGGRRLFGIGSAN